MKRLQPVIWTKGTFLSPQHLQLQDRYLENLLQFQLEGLSFRPWGFRSLQISQEALSAGAFGISSAAGILPDGLLFEIPGSDSAPPPRPLADSDRSRRRIHESRSRSTVGVWQKPKYPCQPRR